MQAVEAAGHLVLAVLVAVVGRKQMLRQILEAVEEHQLLAAQAL
jgi:hypothetical protein